MNRDGWTGTSPPFAEAAVENGASTDDTRVHGKKIAMGQAAKSCDPDQHGPEDDAGVAMPLEQQLTPIRSRLQGLRDVSS